MTKSINTYGFTGPTFQVYADADAVFLGVAESYGQPTLYVLVEMNAPIVRHHFVVMRAFEALPNHVGKLVYLDKFVDQFGVVSFIFKVVEG